MRKRNGKIGALALAAVLTASFVFTSCSIPLTPEADPTAAPTATPTADPQNLGEFDAATGTDAVQTVNLGAYNLLFSERDKSGKYAATEARSIVFNGTGATVSNGATVKGADVTVTAAGTYLVSGSSENGSITVAVDKAEKVQIVLAGVNLTNPDGAAIYIKTADKVFLTVAENTENTISDGSSYSVTDGTTTIDAPIFSKQDLCVNGSGKLTVNGKYKHGIVSKDDLIIGGAQITVNAKKVALSGKDCVKIAGGTLHLTAGSDGIRSDNEKDAGRGFVYIAGGEITVNAENDCVQAQTVLKIDGGTLHLVSGGGSVNSSTKSDGSVNAGWGFGGASAGDVTENKTGKALKAVSDILITGGEITVDSADDAVHTDGNFSMIGGRLTVSSGDDGIHADAALGFSGGVLQVTKCYEGLEASQIVIAGGRLTITAKDDCINAAGGNDASSLGNRPGKNTFASMEASILISGGYITLNAGGDGVDSNGDVTVTGGLLLISAAIAKSGSSANDSAIDCGDSAKSVIRGGIVVGLCHSGVQEKFSQTEQGSLYITFALQEAGTNFALTDENGNVAASFTPAKSYNCAVVSVPDLAAEKMQIVLGGTVSGADENGFAHNATLTGGTVVTPNK